jgi:hypothetical protein
MKCIIWFFSRLYRLYPADFRARFGSELDEVFLAGLKEAREQGRLLGFILHEAIFYPASLVSAYLWSMSAGKDRQVAVSSMGGGGTTGMTMPGEGWGSSILAGIPHLLMGIIVVSSEIIYNLNRTQTATIILLIVFIALVIEVLIYNLLKGWKSWSGSWITYIGLLVIVLLTQAVNVLSESLTGNINWVNTLQFIVLPLLIAYLLYKMACQNRLWGLLSAIPPMAIIWTFFLEFVPSAHKALAYSWIFLLAFAAAVWMLRTKRSWAALGLAMAVPILGGLPFAYLGVYEGGTLPFSQPGPSLLEAFRQYLPVLVMALAIVLGPQLAVKLRMIGYESEKKGGKIIYRLVLVGILAGLLYSLMDWGMSASFPQLIYILLQVRQISLILGAILFIVGFALLTYAVWKGKNDESDNSNLLHLGALFLPLLFLPIMILLVRPLIMGQHINSWLILAGIAWVVAAGLVVKD